MPHKASANDRRNGHLAMLTFSFLVAGSFSLGAMAANEITPLAINGLRFVLAALIVGVLALVTGGIPRASFKQPWRYAILGGIFALYFVMMFVGLKTATPVSASAVFTLTPVLAAFFGYLIMRQITTRRIAVALAIGAAGALWVIFRADIKALLAFQIGKGEALYLIGVVAHAIYTPLVPRLHRGERTFVFTFFILSAASIVILAFGWRDILATDRLDHLGLSRRCRHHHHRLAFGLCLRAFGGGKSHGLHLSCALMGDHLGNFAGSWRAADVGVRWDRLDDFGALFVAQTRGVNLCRSASQWR